MGFQALDFGGVIVGSITRCGREAIVQFDERDYSRRKRPD